jgi:phage recombination protein Bet
MNGIAKAEPQRASVTVAMAQRFGMDPLAFEQTLRATVVPKDCSREQLAAFLLVAKEYSLNPLTKEIYAFPSRGGGIQPIVSIDGWLNIMNSHPQMDGLEFEDHLDGGGKLTAVTARIWRKDRTKPTTVTEYMAECKRATDTWKQWPARMLRHKAAIQCARYAFGFAGIMDPDEFERWQEKEKPARAKAQPVVPDIEPESSEIRVPDITPEEPDTEGASEEAVLNDLNTRLEQCATLKAVQQVEREFASVIVNMTSDGRELAIEWIQAAKAGMDAEAAE